MSEYSHEILNWEPINTNSFSLLAKIEIKPTIELLELFKRAPLNNILCKVSGTNSDYDNKVVYGIIDKSEWDDTYYITLDHIWNSYPDKTKQGKIEFFPKSVEATINYINDKAGPLIPASDFLENTNQPKEVKKIQTYGSSSPIFPKEEDKETSDICNNPRMQLSDILLPIGLSLVLIGLLQYIFPKKFFN